jgi:solute carrier family 39 (zinc transporter), member 10
LLGDFAVLLQAGMSAKEAICYNLLSSLLCFVGMLIGITLGHSPAAAEWIFAIAAGTFLYIALVDMVIKNQINSFVVRLGVTNTGETIVKMIV